MSRLDDTPTIAEVLANRPGDIARIHATEPILCGIDHGVLTIHTAYKFAAEGPNGEAQGFLLTMIGHDNAMATWYVTDRQLVDLHKALRRLNLTQRRARRGKGAK